MEHKHVVYMYYGSIYNMHDNIIENPALLIDTDGGCVHGYGDIKDIEPKFINMVAAYNSAGFHEMAKNLILMDFSTAWFKGMSNEEICYILRRAVEHTATTFQPALIEHMEKPDFQEWLRAEMKRFPLDLEEKTYKWS